MLNLTIIWGGTGQCKVARPILENHGYEVIAVFDDTDTEPPFSDIPLYHGSQYPEWLNENSKFTNFCIAIGNPHGKVRQQLHKRLQADGLAPITIKHSTAWVANNAVVGSGCQLMAGAKIMEEATLGIQCIINTNASVDHECTLGAGTELAPGATLCGSVTTEENVWICAGATVLPRISIGKNSIIGAGAVVIDDVPPNITVVGVPARPIIKRD